MLTGLDGYRSIADYFVGRPIKLMSVDVLRDCVHDIPFRFFCGLPTVAQRPAGIYYRPILRADLWRANLKGARLVAAIVNARTFIWGCEFDTQTDFTGMEADLARIDPQLRESLRTEERLIQR
jgi:hypothetical protein